MPAQVAGNYAYCFQWSETKECVQNLDWIKKETVAIVNTRKARPLYQAGSQNLLPELLHFRRLGEEAVSAYIEEKSFVRYRPGQTANNFVRLEDEWNTPLTSQLQGRAKAGRTAAENYGSRSRIGLHLA